MSNERKLIRDDDYPSNSNKEKTKPDKKVEKIVSGVVVKQKKGLGKRFSENFLGDDSKNVGTYVLYDVFIPAAKETIVEMVKSAIEMLMFGERRNRSRSSSGGSYTSYGSYFKTPDRRPDGRREISRQGRARHDFDEIMISDRGEAEKVLFHLYDLCEDYGMASVADFYDLVGIDSNFTDQKYGWTDLRGVTVERVRGGYIIDLPRAKPLD